MSVGGDTKENQLYTVIQAEAVCTLRGRVLEQQDHALSIKDECKCSFHEQGEKEEKEDKEEKEEEQLSGSVMGGEKSRRGLRVKPGQSAHAPRPHTDSIDQNVDCGMITIHTFIQ